MIPTSRECKHNSSPGEYFCTLGIKNMGTRHGQTGIHDTPQSESKATNANAGAAHNGPLVCLWRSQSLSSLGIPLSENKIFEVVARWFSHTGSGPSTPWHLDTRGA